MQRMSFAMTTDQVRRRRKTVTRRFGWLRLRPGDRLLAVERCMGFRRGERAPDPIAVIEVVSVRRERLDAIDDADVAREGFPDRDAAWFVAMLCDASGRRPADICTRIEFRYVDQEEDHATCTR